MTETTEPTELDASRAASAFAALGSEQRLAILEVLVRAGPSGLSMGVLGERTGVSGSTLTHHLKVLHAAGLVHQRRQGRQIVCAAVAFDMAEQLSNYLLRHCCAESYRGACEHG